MFRYKPDQGVYARGTTFWALLAFAALAGNRFYYWAQGFGDWPNKRLVADRVPVLGLYITPAFILGVVLFAALAYVSWRAVNHARLGDLLIETEAEMKKVTWPSFEDTKKSSLIVIGCVIFMLVFLGVSDFVLNWVFQELIY